MCKIRGGGNYASKYGNYILDEQWVLLVKIKSTYKLLMTSSKGT